ncbi:MAG TPA: molybdenum cofactor biosynthesis protein MoaE [Bacilli bacterium]
MRISIILFAGLSELFGSSVIHLILEESPLTVQELKLKLIAQYPSATVIIQQSFVTRNRTYAAEMDLLTESDEIALIPPVSGGESAEGDPAIGLHRSNNAYVITFDPISVEEVTAKVIRPGHGAAIAFVGTTREFTHGKRTILLEYEAYQPMALLTMEQIGGEIAARWPETEIAITHRLGKVGISEISVVIAVSSAHRVTCYEASRYAIERLKQIVPIWKKEIWEDGSEWKGHQQGSWNPTLPLQYE